jgi:hypothetical protein
LTSTCTATKRDGSPCTLPSTGPNGLCWAHDPANAERRRRGQSRGGKSKPSKELVGIKQRLLDLAEDVLAGAVERSNAAVVGQLLNTYLSAVRTELKVREVEDLAREVEELRTIIDMNTDRSA